MSSRLSEKEFGELAYNYNRINNSFGKTVLFHVGVEGGFHSEVDGMMQCMLYCYKHGYKFMLYSDDANFASGNGWNEFFESFCDENHNPINKRINMRRFFPIYRPDLRMLEKKGRKALKKEGIDLLTQDIFWNAIDRRVSTTEVVEWDLFGVNGCTLDEFGKLSDLVLRFNEKTNNEVEELIRTLKLPEEYYSIQMRGGDKISEYKQLNSVDELFERIDEMGISFRSLFVFTDDYSYINLIQEKYPNINLYTLCNKNEQGYYNDLFQGKEWNEKRKDMIKLFAMIEICLRSDCHLGNENSCVNNYIRSKRLNTKGYIPLWSDNDGIAINKTGICKKIKDFIGSFRNYK